MSRDWTPYELHINNEFYMKKEHEDLKKINWTIYTVNKNGEKQEIKESDKEKVFKEKYPELIFFFHDSFNLYKKFENRKGCEKEFKSLRIN